MYNNVAELLKNRPTFQVALKTMFENPLGIRSINVSLEGAHGHQNVKLTTHCRFPNMFGTSVVVVPDTFARTQPLPGYGFNNDPYPQQPQGQMVAYQQPEVPVTEFTWDDRGPIMERINEVIDEIFLGILLGDHVLGNPQVIGRVKGLEYDIDTRGADKFVKVTGSDGNVYLDYVEKSRTSVGKPVSGMIVGQLRLGVAIALMKHTGNLELDLQRAGSLRQDSWGNVQP